MRLAILLLSLLVPCTTAHGVTRLVPSQYSTIQAGIDASTAGDIVEVASGTYYEHDIDMENGVTLRGETGDPADVVVDAQQLGVAIRCSNCDAPTRIEGLTFTNGSSDNGGGLFCVNSSPVVVDCDFTENHANHYGGGVACGSSSSPSLTGCSFTSNTCDYYGGGVHGFQASPQH